MEGTLSARQVETAQAAGAAGRLTWQEPAIVLERSLLAKAQDPQPTRRTGRTRGGFLGPLDVSGGVCED